MAGKNSVRALGIVSPLLVFVEKRDLMRFLEVEQPWMFQNNMVLEVDRAHGVQYWGGPLYMGNM